MLRAGSGAMSAPSAEWRTAGEQVKVKQNNKTGRWFLWIRYRCLPCAYQSWSACSVASSAASACVYVDGVQDHADPEDQGLAEINHHLQPPLGGSEGSRPGSSQPPLPSLPALVLPPSASLPPSPPSPSPPPPLPRRHRRHSRHGHRLRFRCAQRSVRCASGAR